MRPDKGQFFPGEVARMLHVESLDYRQLRAMYALVRAQAGYECAPKEWARFSYEDIAATLEVVRLCIESQGIDTKKAFRLVLLRLNRACMKLRSYGFSNPLLQVQLVIEQGRVVAEVDGAKLDAETGQQLIDLAAVRVTDYFATTDIDTELLRLLESVRTTQRAATEKRHLIFS